MRIVYFISAILISFTSMGWTQFSKDQRIATIAGELAVFATDDMFHYEVTLNGKTILTPPKDSPNPVLSIHTFYSREIPPFAEIVLFQYDSGGNACNGGPFQFLGLNHDGSFQFSEIIDYCGGPTPKITWSEDAVKLFFPGSGPNRGEGWIRSETWIYKNGEVRKGPSE